MDPSLSRTQTPPEYEATWIHVIFALLTMIDLDTWRARIGSFLPINSNAKKSRYANDNGKSSEASYCVLPVAVMVTLMLILAGDIELNPGPLPEEEKKCLHTMSHDQLKEKGNQCIMAKRYDDAILYYSSALEKNPESHAVLSNRSLAYSKVNDFKLALKDAENCITIMPKFARGYLRKSVALYGLELYEQSMVSAQEGYRLRGSDSICRDCIAQWILACKQRYRDLVDKNAADFGWQMPKQFLVTSAEYSRIYRTLFYARLGLSNVDMPFIKECITSTLGELDCVLQLFGHSSNSFGQEWCEALGRASKLNAKTSRVSPDAVTDLLQKSQIFSSWLDTDIDPILFPVVSPILSLILIAAGVHYISLNAQNTNQHVTQVACQSVLTFFNTSMLSTEHFIDQHIAVYKELLEAFALSLFTFTAEEVQLILRSIKTTEGLIEKCPKDELMEEIYDAAMVSIGLARIRLNEEPKVNFADHAKDSGKAASKTAGDNPDRFRAYVAEKEELLQHLLNQPTGFTSFLTTDILDLLDCVGSLIDIGETDRAIDIFTKCEMGYVRIFHEQLGNSSFPLDEAPSAFNQAQTVLFSAASKFIHKEDWLVANIILRWKCIYSEFRTLLMKLGVGRQYLQTFRAIQEVKLKAGQGEEAYTLITEEHHQGVRTIIQEIGPDLFLALMRQSQDDIVERFHTGDILLDFQLNPHGILVVMQSNGKVAIYTLKSNEIVSLSEEWAITLGEIDGSKAKVIAKRLCELLIPDSVKMLICSAEVERMYMCPDWKLGVLPLELLEFPDGELLTDKCPIAYLSSSRELIRKSTYEELLLKRKEIVGTDTEIMGTDTERERKSTCVVVADPDYNLKTKSPEEDTDGQNWGSFLTSIFNSFFTMTPSEGATANKLPVPPLDNSREEALDIELLCSTATHPIKTRCLLGAEATLKATIQLDNPTVLHFSTHGFSHIEARGVHGSFWADTWTGLVLAGVNTYRLKEFDRIVKEAGTGELTSLAVCGMNLQETKLVYLSTCVSSYGYNTTGEAINSLAQAFRTAGAGTVIATLWQILDESARKFAVHFYYKAFETGVRPSAAIVYAKNMLREEENSHHLLWSSFICIGEDLPIFQ